MQKLAVIDIGTNSVRLLIGEKSDNNDIVPIYSENKITRLGEGVDKDNYLKPDAIMRSIAVIEEYKEIIQLMNVENFCIIATSAVRDAENKEQFANIVNNKIGKPLEILSGKEEAQRSYLGVIKGLKKNIKHALVIDIGGGSTEITWGLGETIIEAQSMQMGAVRLTERFGVKDSTNSNVHQLMVRYIDQELKRCLSVNNLNSETQVIGVGGTATTCAAIEQRMKIYDWKAVHGYILDINKIGNIHAMLSSKTLIERQVVSGLQPARADVIIAGVTILLQIMHYLNCKTITISETDLLYGTLIRLSEI